MEHISYSLSLGLRVIWNTLENAASEWTDCEQEVRQVFSVSREI